MRPTSFDLSACTRAGKELDLKFAVALEEPDPASGVQAKLRARLRVREAAVGAAGRVPALRWDCMASATEAQCT